MSNIIALIAKPLNSWTEIGSDDDARLRSNSIVYAYLITLIAIIMCLYNTFFSHDALIVFIDYAFLVLCGASIVIQIKKKHHALLLNIVLCSTGALMLNYVVIVGSLDGLLIFIACPFMFAVLLILGNVGNFVNAYILVSTAIIYFFSLPKRDYSDEHVFAVLFFLLFSLVCAYIFNKLSQKTQLKLRQLSEQLTENAYTDFLTSIGNRHAFKRYSIETAITDSVKLYALIDIDHFKNINDTYGHSVGDEVLRQISSLLVSSVRSTDQVFRWGGEEFLIVSTCTDDQGCEAYLERIRLAVEKNIFRVAGTEVNMTVSIGAFISREGEDPDAAINQADKHLYQSKSGGRNMVTTGNSAEATIPGLGGGMSDEVK